MFLTSTEAVFEAPTEAVPGFVARGTALEAGTGPALVVEGLPEALWTGPVALLAGFEGLEEEEDDDDTEEEEDTVFFAADAVGIAMAITNDC